jgi:EmrB/QacA subfamily drug resistance transporter
MQAHTLLPTVLMRLETREATGGRGPSRAAKPLTESERRDIIIGALTAMLLAALDQTIIAPALATIGAKLGNTEYLSWVVTAYLLTATAVTPLYGKLADLRGRRIVILFSLGVFILGSIGCALAPNLFVLIAARAVQGIGGGGLISLALTIIGDVVAPRERAIYQGYFSGVWALASIAGPGLGGLLTEHVHWSMIFWINLPLAAIAVLVMDRPLRLLHLPRREHRLDWLGALLIMAMTITFLLILTWGGARFAWTSPPIVGLFVTLLVLSVWFAEHTRRVPEPLLPVSVLRNSIVLAVAGAVFFAMTAFVGVSVYLPLYFEGLLHLRVGQAGLGLIPMMAGTVLGAAISGKVSAKVIHYKRIAMSGIALAIVSIVYLSIHAGRLPFILVAGTVATAGAGIGTLFPIATVSVQNAVEPGNLGIATATLTFLRSLGGAIGVAALGSVFLGQGIVIQSIGVRHELSADESTDFALQHAFVFVFGLAAAALVAGEICLIVMREKPWRSAHDSSSQLRPEKTRSARDERVDSHGG